MGLYKLFSCNVEIQYKGCLLSKAMMFTIITTIINILLPFFIAQRSKGFWLKTHHFYEQPFVHFTYEYLLIGETDDPSTPIICGSISPFTRADDFGEENCVEIQVKEHDTNRDWIKDVLNIKFKLNIPSGKSIASLILILALDFQLKSVCPLHMQSLAVINKDFPHASSGFKFQGDLEFYQISHLPCVNNVIDTEYNASLFRYITDSNQNIVDSMLEKYYKREAVTTVKILDSRSKGGHTGTMDIEVNLRVPEMKIQYKTSFLQELKWAWPQYLSLFIIFHILFNKLKRFVFNNRLLMAWKTEPWKRD